MYFTNSLLICSLLTGVLWERKVVYSIVGGGPAPNNRWPGIVSIRNPALKSILLSIAPTYMNWTLVGNTSHICGGTLINKRWVVSARHCLMASDFEGKCTDFVDDWTVRLGFHDQNSATLADHVINVVEIYVMNKQCTDYWTSGDIALLKLEKDAPISETVKVVDLPPANWDDNAPEGHVCYGVGWGSAISISQAVVNQKMKEIQMSIESNCSKRYAGTEILKDEICSKPEKGCDGPCRGDSGGPLFCSKDNTTFFLSGIASRRIHNCTDCYPTLYNNVFIHKAAIEGIVKGNLTPTEIEKFGFFRVPYSSAKQVTVSVTAVMSLCSISIYSILCTIQVCM